MRYLLIVLSVLFLVSCQGDPLPVYVELGTLRVLEIQADNPEVNAGAAVTLTPYVSDINNVGALTFAWQACVDPGISYGAEPTCTGSTTATAVTTGAVTGLNAGNTFTGAVGTVLVNVPANILSLASSTTLYNGIAYLVTYNVTNTSGYTVKSFKRILVSDPSKAVKNTNPTIAQVLGDGLVLGTLNVGQTVQLSMNSSSQESYSIMNSNGSLTTQTETLQTTWFYSEGTAKYYRTLGSDTNQFTAPESYPASRSSFIIAVLRDGRGGIAVQKVVIHP